ncbi:substrate-binding periplasmic protein [Leptospira sp. GIMC2001]|uniref:substrate-binding periplasmic protein n=1 Tax=Leptospira sp. GIMC2001 TaxID=1513297 RepID=UPI002348F323|nr:transporter substrate-binding domain-containing protein [Leptospira sp. GIMC2001]WCL49507.1 transporter substrate-binding domain-containing protein [Leptospira sp. GIMC2001]
MNRNFMKVTYFCVLALSLSISNSLNAESSTLQKILKTKTLTVSVNQFYDPFYIDDPVEGSPGLDVEIAQEYAKYLGVNLKILPLRDFDEHANRLDKGDTQIAIAGISTSLERFRKVYFTDPYLITSPAGLINRQILPPEPEGQIITSAPFRSLLDLQTVSGILFSVRSNGPNHAWLKKNFPKFPIYSYLDDFRAVNELRKNNVNVYVADTFRIQALLQKEPALKTNYLPLLSSVQEENLSMAVAQGDIEFLYHLNFFIKEIRRNGWLNKLSYKYFSTNQWIKK